MEVDVDSKMREEQLQIFETFINESYNKIDCILKDIGWSRERVIEEGGEMVCCPLNNEHRMPEGSLQKHLELCSWRKEGYHELDIPLPDAKYSNNPSAGTTCFIDANLQTSIIRNAKEQDPSLVTGTNVDTRPIPKSSDRLMADFTTDERRILYDYVIAETTPADAVKVEELNLISDLKKEKQDRPKSHLELLIEQRDAKRRRISYRKKVHTNRKTHTEILREVIESQMEVLEQVIREEIDEDKDAEDKNKETIDASLSKLKEETDDARSRDSCMSIRHKQEQHRMGHDVHERELSTSSHTKPQDYFVRRRRETPYSSEEHRHHRISPHTSRSHRHNSDARRNYEFHRRVKHEDEFDCDYQAVAHEPFAKKYDERKEGRYDRYRPHSSRTSVEYRRRDASYTVAEHKYEKHDSNTCKSSTNDKYSYNKLTSDAECAHRDKTYDGRSHCSHSKNESVDDFEESRKKHKSKKKHHKHKSKHKHKKRKRSSSSSSESDNHVHSNSS